MAAITCSGSIPSSLALAVHAASTAAIESVRVPSWRLATGLSGRGSIGKTAHHVKEDTVSGEVGRVGPFLGMVGRLEGYRVLLLFGRDSAGHYNDDDD